MLKVDSLRGQSYRRLFCLVSTSSTRRDRAPLCANTLQRSSIHQSHRNRARNPSDSRVLLFRLVVLFSRCIITDVRIFFSLCIQYQVSTLILLSFLRDTALRASFCAQVCAGLHYLHDGWSETDVIIHRDIKLENSKYIFPKSWSVILNPPFRSLIDRKAYSENC